MQAKAGAALDEGDEEVEGKESLDKDATTSQFPWLFKTAHAKIECPSHIHNFCWVSSTFF